MTKTNSHNSKTAKASGGYAGNLNKSPNFGGSFGGVDPNLRQALAMASYASPNYTEAASGQEDHFRNGRKTPNHSLGYAMDMGVYDAAGNLIANGTNEAGAPAYTDYGRTAYDALGTFAPQAQKNLRAGVNFSDQDSMHYDMRAYAGLGPLNKDGTPVHNIYANGDDYSAPRYLNAFAAQSAINNKIHPELANSLLNPETAPYAGATPNASLGLGDLDTLSPNSFSFGAPVGGFENNVAQAPRTLGDRLRETLGLPTTLGIQAVNGVISLGQLAEAAAANVAQQSAAAQNPQAAPPSSFPSRPAGPVSSNQFSAKTPGPVAQGPDLSSPLGRMNAAIGRNPNAGVASATPTNDYRDTPQDRMRAAVGAPPAASYQGPGQRGFSPPAASSYDTLGMTAGPTGFSTGGMFSAGPQAMGAAMGSFSKPAATKPAQAAKQPAHPSSAYAGPGPTMPLGFSQPAATSVPDMSALNAPTQAAMDTQKALNDYTAAASALTGPAPGAVSNKKPGEPGYQAPAPSVPKLTPKMPQKQAAPAPVAARPLAPPQSQFAPQTPVYNDIGSIVGAIGQAGQAYTPDFAPNTSVYNQGGQVVGSISGRTTQASPLSSGGLSSLGGLFNNGSAALGSLGGFASAIGGYNSGTSKAYGNQNYGTRSYGGNGGSTLGGGDNHRAL